MCLNAKKSHVLPNMEVLTNITTHAKYFVHIIRQSHVSLINKLLMFNLLYLPSTSRKISFNEELHFCCYSAFVFLVVSSL